MHSVHIISILLNRMPGCLSTPLDQIAYQRTAYLLNTAWHNLLTDYANGISNVLQRLCVCVGVCVCALYMCFWKGLMLFHWGWKPCVSDSEFIATLSRLMVANLASVKVYWVEQ